MNKKYHYDADFMTVFNGEDVELEVVADLVVTEEDDIIYGHTVNYDVTDLEMFNVRFVESGTAWGIDADSLEIQVEQELVDCFRDGDNTFNENWKEVRTNLWK